MLNWIIEEAATYVEFLCALYFIQDAAASRRMRIWNGLLALFMSIHIIFINMSKLVSYNAIMGYLVYMAFVSWLLYRKNWGEKILLSFLFLLLITICDFFTMSWMAAFFKDHNFAGRVMAIDSDERISFLLVDKGTLVIWTILLKYFIQKYITEEKYKFLIALGSVAVSLVYVTCNISSIYALFGWSIYIIAVCAGALTFCFYRKWKEAEVMKEHLQMQSIAGMEYYEGLCRKQEEKEKIVHDVRYHCLSMAQMLEEGRYEECSRYIYQFRDTIIAETYTTFTGNRYVDFMINFKRHEAKELGIDVVVNADLIGEAESFLPEDINIILGNLFDNAIEACRNMEEGEKWIEIKISKRKMMLFITIRNSYGEQPKTVNNRLVTQKEDAGIHGLGLKNVRAHVDKYNGTLDINFTDHIFTVELTIFL